MKGTGEYAVNQKEIHDELKNFMSWRCERCRRPHDPAHGYTLTVHHLDGNKSNNEKWNLLKSIESKKNLQGMFEEKEFFIRLVKKYEDIEYRYGDLVFQDEGLHSVYCDISDDTDSIFTPCTYIVSCKTIPTLTELVSYRGRFTEQVSKGMHVEASGRLESVQIR